MIAQNRGQQLSSEDGDKDGQIIVIRGKGKPQGAESPVVAQFEIEPLPNRPVLAFLEILGPIEAFQFHTKSGRIKHDLEVLEESVHAQQARDRQVV